MDFQYSRELERLRTLALDDTPIDELLKIVEDIVPELHPDGGFEGMRIADLAEDVGNKAASDFFRFLMFHHAGVSTAMVVLGTLKIMRSRELADNVAKRKLDQISRRLSAYIYAVAMDCMRKAEEVRKVFKGRSAKADSLPPLN